MIFEAFQEALKEISWKVFYLYKKIRSSSFIKESKSIHIILQKKINF